MNKLLLAAIVALATGSAAAQTEDPAYTLYRAAVLGDSSAKLPTAPKAAESGTRLVPGDYARKLIHDGVSEREALAQAAAIGESPRFVVHKPNPLAPYSSYELYQLGVLGATDADIRHGRGISSSRDADVAQRATR